ncbi:hypothetical protein [Enterovirga sp.]|jgi:hypothetical protein|uniref:hypothetical protein n=1 Tax=Enterovirga sp. TaxID=2026350 RepID=UPI002608D020|nr:hypothetical protein [Enterovirga sp.]MDB5591975.1 hypothetical protein [Enterovirga sp.]
MVGSRSAAGVARTSLRPAFAGIARRIGMKLRDVYASPEAEALPAEHVELLLRLRHKERDAGRARRA